MITKDKWKEVMKYRKGKSLAEKLMLNIVYKEYRVLGGKREVDIDGTNDLLMIHLNMCTKLIKLIHSWRLINKAIEDRDSESISKLMNYKLDNTLDMVSKDDIEIKVLSFNEDKVCLKLVYRKYGNDVSELTNSICIESGEEEIKRDLAELIKRYTIVTGEKLGCNQSELVEYLESWMSSYV